MATRPAAHVDMNDLVRYDQVVQSLSQAVAHGMGGIENVPKLLGPVIDKAMWKHRIVQKTGEVVHFERFEDFVEAHPPEGLGTTFDVLLAICKQHGKEVKPKLLRVRSELNPVGTNQHTVGVDNINSMTGGDSASYKLARLKRDHPGLAERVIEGELSAHAAAVEAGFANPKISVNLKNLESAARTLTSRLEAAEIYELIDWLYKLVNQEDL